jgi:hypothetical protein
MPGTSVSRSLEPFRPQLTVGLTRPVVGNLLP